MSNLSLTMAIPEYDHTRDVVSGRVPVEGIDLTCLNYPVEEIFYRFIVYKEFDVAEISFAKYSALTASGNKDFFALPVFPSRVFRHSSIYVRKGGPVKKIGDLKGAKVGIPEWAQTAAVYSRGFLQDQYGIKLSSIKWVQAGVNQPGRIEKVDLKLPKGVAIERVADKSLNEMLLSGDLDAIMVARPPDAFVKGNPKIQRLFDDFMDVEIDYYKRTGIFPIMHAVAVRRDVLAKTPWVARNLFTAFEEARRRSIARVLDSTVSLFPIPWYFEHARRGMELFGKDYFPYGIEPNRKTLEAFLKWGHEQGVCKRLVDVDEMFPDSLHSTHKV
jgi:4,5-dihydroxyphthalate decarboxylase